MGLAPVIIEEVFKVIERLKQARTTTILLVEQLAFMALKVADRAYVLEQGVVSLQGTAAEMKDNPKVREAYLGVTKKV
jgi:branched-chain amino acid transport system ATP-binding protein